MNAYRQVGFRLLALGALACSACACARTHPPSSFEVRDPALAGRGAEGDARGSAGANAARNQDGRSAATTSSTGGAAGAADATRAGAPSADASTAHGGSNAADDPPEPAADPASPGDDPATADASAGGTRTEVWVGELWSVAPALCDPNAPLKSDRPLVVEPMGYIDRAVLILEHAADGSLRGVVQLGEGDPPQSPGEAPYAMGDSGTYWLCSIYAPTRGIEYTLREIALTVDRLRFEIAVGEAWNEWCATQHEPCPGSPDGTCLWVHLSPDEGMSDSICECEGDRCTGAEQSHVAFDLRITADTIEGQLPFGGAFGTPSQLRMQRVQP